MTIVSSIVISVIIGSYLGWKARGYLDQALVRVLWRLITSDIGKKKALEVLNNAIQKAEK